MKKWQGAVSHFETDTQLDVNPEAAVATDWAYEQNYSVVRVSDGKALAHGGKMACTRMAKVFRRLGCFAVVRNRSLWGTVEGEHKTRHKGRGIAVHLKAEEWLELKRVAS